MGDTPHIQLLERVARYMFRPILQIEHGGPLAVEEVAVRYPLGFYDALDSPGSTMTVTGASRIKSGRSRYVRVRVYNVGGFSAVHCRVFVERIWLDGRQVESERSPLHWADRDGVYELPEPMRRGERNGLYVDVCASDSVDPTLQIISQKALKGRHRFDKSGLYKIELCAEADTPCSFGHFALCVRYEVGNWDSLHVVSIKQQRRLMLSPWRME